MGPHQYIDHAGMRNGKSMSGARLWAEAEAAREAEYTSGSPNKLGTELALLQDVAHDIHNFIPSGAKVIELGPGTLRSFRKKTLPLIRALKSNDCLIIDISAAFLKDITVAESAAGIRITPIEEDFFAGASNYQKGNEPVLVCAFGGIISNLVAPLSDTLPEKLLSDTLANYSNTIRNGWMLVAFDSSEDPEAITAYYSKHALFQLNIFDRMLVELPLEGDFDPGAFDYKTNWRAASNQLGHMAFVNRDLDFKLAGHAFSFKKGHALHIKNSFKFASDFFEKCCTLAHLKIAHSYTLGNSRCYLLRKEA